MPIVMYIEGEFMGGEPPHRLTPRKSALSSAISNNADRPSDTSTRSKQVYEFIEMDEP